MSQKLAFIFFSLSLLACQSNSPIENEKPRSKAIEKDTSHASINDEGFCTFLDFSFEVAGKTSGGKTQALYQYNEYDDNEPKNPFPDSLILKTRIINYSYTQGNSKTDTFYLKIQAQFKLSLSYSCIMPVNSKTSDTIIVLNTTPYSHSDFFTSKNEKPENYRDIELNKSFPLKSELIKIKEKLKLSNAYMLNQVLISALLSKNKDMSNPCVIESVHPVCVIEMKLKSLPN